MKKLTEKQKKILVMVAIFALLSVLIYSVVNLVLKTSKRDSIETIDLQESVKADIIKEQENIETNPGEEENIALLEENKETKNKEKVKKDDNNEQKSIESDKRYYMRVNYGANVVTVYTKDGEGNYTIPVKAMVCSTGRATPRSGTYGIKNRWEWLRMIGGVYSHFATQITGNILFHSVPYLRNGDHSSLEYWEYDKLRNCLFSRMC